ncbi:gamma-tubulin complex component 4-like [Amphiura filiformis]|uniref:gamma-tubulin complex component 4-like n=1 Tax=Amphiura filiformis TaxID=82378 RepID=UPI003B21D743
MLHELLLALNGYPGSIFREDADNLIKVVPDLPFIHESEEVQLNRLCKLATHYKKLQDFVKRYQGSPCNFTNQQNVEQLNVDTSGNLKDGLYLRALCAGLDEVLNPYRKTLLMLEQQILTDPNLTVGHVQQVLEPYQLLFPELSNVLEQITHLKAHGCYILELLHQFCICGQPIVKEALQKILYVCHCVMYRQVSTWLLHGILLDRHSEFFIHQTTGPVSEERKDDDDDDLGIGGVTGRQMKEVMQLTEDGKLPEKEHHSHYAIRTAMLPNYMPLRIAEKIVFVGESVQMFENKKQNTSKYIVHTDSVLGENEAKFASRLHQLQLEPIFSVQRFEDAVDEIRTCVSEHLWRLVVEEADLIGQLSTLKDYFLLGRGELFLAFIDQSQSLLNTPPMKHTEHDVNVGFQQAAHRVLIEDDATLSQFNLIIKTKFPFKGPTKKSEPKSQGKVSSETGWSCLGMTYNVHWPLHILFKLSGLEKYNTLFQFLLHVKRVQLELQQCWAMQMQCKHEEVSQSDGQKWLLRSHMAFLIDNLQYYMQVDVLETQFSQLVDKVRSTRDFEAVRFAHDQFITSLMAQCFLLMKPVNHCLTEILEVCHSFCMLLTQNSKLTNRDYAHMDKLAQAFNRQSSLLFKILSGVQSHQASRHLTQLLLRLDYNKFYSKAQGVLARPSPGSTP